MKIAVVTDDQKTISAHFGRAQYYLVFNIENGKITGSESRPKANHNHFAGQEHAHEHAEQHGTDPQSENKHASMLDTIVDCQVLVARGMGQGAYDSMVFRNIHPIITNISDAQAAVESYLAGSIDDHPEKLH
jgi:predicted Fe-Mo cluster-binding NifX family protein